MKKLSFTTAVFVSVGLLLAGCGQKPVPSGSPPPPAPASPAAVPFSQLKAPSLNTVDFVSDTVGYVGGQGLILKSGDGGQTWLKLYTSPDNVLSVDAVDGVNVWAATKDYLLQSTDGLHFQRVDVPGLSSGNGGKGVQAINFVTRDQGFILANGVVWRLTGGGSPAKATPPGPVDALSFVDPNTGFAAGGNVVYKTLDGGKTWHKVFTAPVQSTDLEGSWRADIHAASAANAWLLVAGGGHDMSQQAYVIYHTTDGTAFIPVMYEGHFASLYPTVHLTSDKNIGAQPASFTVYGNQAAFFVGWYPEQLQLTRTVDNGKTFGRFNIGKPGDPTAPDFSSPMGISFVDGTHGWLAGNHQDQKGQRQGVLLYTTDGMNFKAVP
ncbi:MAG TPA: hypothetical protein VMW83_11170 [Spirochaetia bacterium]|nr:hypothetical protein [Spirochaetia bacterium]